MWQVRTKILNRDDQVSVNDFKLKDFFSEYAEAHKIPIKIEVQNLGLNYQFRNPKPIAISYSGGSESILMDSLYCGVNCVMGYNFFPYRQRKREFQLGLLAIAEDYAAFMVGICSTFGNEDPNSFEVSLDFPALWNKYFHHSIQYPMTYAKHEVYEYLYSMVDENGHFNGTKRKLIIATCEEKNAPCHKCWKCAEQHLFTDAVAKRFPEWKVPEYPVDQDLLNNFRRENEHFFQAKVDPYTTMDMLIALEEDWDYKKWRKPISRQANL